LQGLTGKAASCRSPFFVGSDVYLPISSGTDGLTCLQSPCATAFQLCAGGRCRWSVASRKVGLAGGRVWEMNRTDAVEVLLLRLWAQDETRG